MGLTKKQAETFRFIRQYLNIYGYAPAGREIAEGIGIRSTGVVHRYVEALISAGYLGREGNGYRNICLATSCVSSNEHAQKGGMSLPLLGAIAAGAPIDAILRESDDEGHLDLSQILGPNRFALKVKGDSMIGDNIRDGDYVICEASNTAENGEIVVVLVDREETTLKRIQKNTCGTVSLVPSNPAMDAMVFEAERISVQGKYLGLIRI